MRTIKQPSRLMGIVAQPLIFWAIMGSGFVNSFQLSEDPSSKYANFFFPGMLAMVILFSTIFNTITLIEDRNSGFMQSVLVSPSSRNSIVAGKIGGVALISFIQTAILLALASAVGIEWVNLRWIYGLGIMIIGTVALAGAGFILAWLSPTTSSYHAVMSAVLIPLWLVSGAVFPVQSTWLQYIVWINPMSWLVVGLRAFFNNGRVPLGVAPEWLTAETAFILLSIFAVSSYVGSVLVCERKKL